MPDDGTGIGIIIAVLVVLVLGAIALFLLISRRAKASKGGVEPPSEERETRQAPPIESVERRS